MLEAGIQSRDARIAHSNSTQLDSAIQTAASKTQRSSKTVPVSGQILQLPDRSSIKTQDFACNHHIAGFTHTATKEQ